ncbi:hypothetical protein, partial [Azoarcus sp. TTM-91]|uniref:hypothetical protein n=1 Tax=Azoarcus sp. TTM-91 TaxID=2691581 RepID=UPI001B7CEC49
MSVIELSISTLPPSRWCAPWALFFVLRHAFVNQNRLLPARASAAIQQWRMALAGRPGFIGGAEA